MAVGRGGKGPVLTSVRGGGGGCHFTTVTPQGKAAPPSAMKALRRMRGKESNGCGDA